MIHLKNTDSLEVVLAGAMTTSHSPLCASYADVAADATTLAPSSTDGATNGTTAVTWVAAPSSGLVRQIKELSLVNDDSVTITATVRINNGSTTRRRGRFVLLTGERLAYSNGRWEVFTSDGAPRTSVATAETGRHAVYIAAGSMSPSASGGCAALTTLATSSNQPDIQTLDFDPTNQEFAQFGIRMPESWNESTISFVPVWTHAATTTNFGVVWSLGAVAMSNDDTIAATFGTVQTSTDTGGTTSDVYIGPESSAITIAGSPQPADMVFFRVARVPGDAADTMAVDAKLIGIIVYITTDAGTD